MVNRLVFLFLVITSFAMAQLPVGIDPSTVSKEDLQKYGVTEDDVKRALEQYGSSDSKPKPNPAVKQKEEPVEEEMPVEPKKQNPEPKEENDSTSSRYGESFFDGKLAIYENATHVKPSGNYVLGAGDEISISIWGFSEFNASFIVDENGAISPSLVGKIYLKGVRLEKAREIIKYRFGKVYDLKNSQIAIELNYAKVIRVNIAGEVENPGTYSVSAVNSAFSILSQAGGLTDIGSLREIKIYREGKLINTLDVYAYMQDPVGNNNFYLLDNDFIVVDELQNVVSVSGGILRPMKYELNDNETLRELIDFSGGLKPNAYRKIVQITRIREDSEELIEFELFNKEDEINSIPLKNGDKVKVLEIPDMVKGYVEVKGAINISGKYALTDSLDLAALIKKAGGIDKDARLDKAILMRLNEDLSKTRFEIDLKSILAGNKSKLGLQEYDEILILSKKDFVDQFEIRVLGEVRNPKNLEFTKGMTLEEALLLTGGMKYSAAETKIQISRVIDFGTSDSSFSKRTIIEEFNLSNNLDATSSIELQPMDIIFVRKNPDFEIQQNITIEGEVVFPGTYSLLSRGETLKEVIERAGGITEWAFLEGARIERGNDDEKFMVLDLKALLEKGKEEYNYVLQAGDKIIIPRTENIVALTGALDYPKIQEIGKVHVPYVKGKKAKYYINKFGGGFASNAAKKKTIVITPGGYVKRTKSFLWIKFYPKVNLGDEIQTFAKVKKNKEKKDTKPLDWNRAIENTTIKLTGVLTLWVLVNNAFN